MIKISKLPLITSPKQFFETDKIALVDVIELPRTHKRLFASLEETCFEYNGRTYLTIVLKGSPENVILVASKGIPFNIGGIKVVYFWSNDLVEDIEGKKIYDFTRYYEKYKHVPFPFKFDTEFIIERYLKTEVCD